MNKKLGSLRSHYEGELLDEKFACVHPLDQFTHWFKEALNSKVLEPNSMILATANKFAIPSVRTVLLKDYDQKGFTFFTNYNSKKGKELNENSNASVLFFWPQLHRQIRIDGLASKIDSTDSEKYFIERPRGSKISAWISPQSNEVENKLFLEANYKEFEKKYDNDEIPFPPFWGGYCLRPTSFEFWQGQPNRLHDRIQYSIIGNSDSWQIKRLAP